MRNPAFEERPEAGARQRADQREVGGMRDEDADVDSVAGGSQQGLHIRGRSDEIGIG